MTLTIPPHRLEAGLGWITKFKKEFTNSENLKTKKKLV
jgi:hypothetical protein